MGNVKIVQTLVKAGAELSVKNIVSVLSLKSVHK
jgi:hypothetical protein